MKFLDLYKIESYYIHCHGIKYPDLKLEQQTLHQIRPNMRIGYVSTAIATVLISATALPGLAAAVQIGGTEITYVDPDDPCAEAALAQLRGERAALAERLSKMMAAYAGKLECEYTPERLVRISLGDRGVLDGFLRTAEYVPGTDQLRCQIEMHTFDGPDEVLVDGTYKGVVFLEHPATLPIQGVSIPDDELCQFNWNHLKNVWTAEPPAFEDPAEA